MSDAIVIECHLRQSTLSWLLQGRLCKLKLPDCPAITTLLRSAGCGEQDDSREIRKRPVCSTRAPYVGPDRPRPIPSFIRPRIYTDRSWSGRSRDPKQRRRRRRCRILPRLRLVAGDHTRSKDHRESFSRTNAKRALCLVVRERAECSGAR